MTESDGRGSQASGEQPVPIAYVTARHPPISSTGTFRVQAVLEHLPGLGFLPTVITLPRGWVAQQAGAGVAASVPAHEAGVLRPDAPFDSLLRTASRTVLLRRLVRATAIPDVLNRWARHVPQAVAGRLGDVRLVLATSPPFSAMLAADRLADHLGVPCVQELRDPPSLDRRARARSPGYAERMVRLEDQLLARAGAVIMVTPGTRARMLELHPRLDPARVFVVTNGYPEDLAIDPSLSGRDPDRFTVTYVGSFRRDGGAGRRWLTPAVILPALSGLPGGGELRIVGPVSQDQRNDMGEGASSPHVTFVGRVPREQAVAEMAAADVALVLAADEPWWIGRKVFEYLAFARRILAVAPEGDTADLLRSSSKSEVVRFGDADGLQAALRRQYEQWRLGELPTGSEPEVPTDRASVEEIARILRLVLATPRHQ